MNEMEKLIRRLLDPETQAPHAAKAAELAARLGNDAPTADATPASTADLAARLDGGLDEDALARQDGIFATSGPDYQDLAAMADLVDTVTTRLATAPADLVAQVAASAVPHRPRRSAPWLWIGGTALAAALAAVLVLSRQPSPTDVKAPVIAAPKDESAPHMLPAGNEDIVPDSRRRNQGGAK